MNYLNGGVCMKKIEKIRLSLAEGEKINKYLTKQGVYFQKDYLIIDKYCNSIRKRFSKYKNYSKSELKAWLYCESLDSELCAWTDLIGVIKSIGKL